MALTRKRNSGNKKELGKKEFGKKELGKKELGKKEARPKKAPVKNLAFVKDKKDAKKSDKKGKVQYLRSLLKGMDYEAVVRLVEGDEL